MAAAGDGDGGETRHHDLAPIAAGKPQRGERDQYSAAKLEEATGVVRTEKVTWYGQSQVRADRPEHWMLRQDLDRTG